MVQNITLNSDDWNYFAQSGKIKLDYLDLEVKIGDDYFIDLGFVNNVLFECTNLIPKLVWGLGSYLKIPEDLLQSRIESLVTHTYDSLNLSKEEFYELLDSQRGEIGSGEDKLTILGECVSCFFHSHESGFKSDIDFHFILARKDSYALQVKTKGFNETSFLIKTNNLQFLEDKLNRKGLNVGLLDLENKNIIADIGAMYALHRKGIDTINLPKDFHISGVAEFLFNESLKYRK